MNILVSFIYSIYPGIFDARNFSSKCILTKMQKNPKIDAKYEK